MTKQGNTCPKSESAAVLQEAQGNPTPQGEMQSSQGVASVVNANRRDYRIEITPQMLRDSFNYDPVTGILIRKKNGRASNSKTGAGHMVTWAFGRALYVHRIAFAITNGRWPENEIDHINGIKTDNRISNLREAMHSENMRNVSAHKRSKTGILGVNFHKASSKFMARIKINGATIYLGLFKTIEDARNARENAELKYHGRFASHISRGSSKP